MQAKLKPGETFTSEIDGETYHIKVMSAADEIRVRAQLTADEAKAKADGDVGQYYAAWAKVVDEFVDGDNLASKVTAETLGKIAAAVTNGNTVSEDEAKN